MAIKSLAPYETKSRSAQEFYGDDMIVHVLRRDSLLYCSGVAFRVPRAMKWKEFVDTQVLPYCKADPDFKEGEYVWKLAEQDFTPSDDQSLEELGVKHKNCISIDVKG